MIIDTNNNNKKRVIRLALALPLLFAPFIQAPADDRTQVAAAIGAETRPSGPVPAAPTKVPTKTAPTETQPAASSPVAAPAESGFTQAQIWLGVGVAAFLGAVGGGGGGGGSPNSTSSSTP